MKRGELYLAAAGSGYAGKPRPVLIVQDDALANLDSVVVCPLSTASPIREPLRIGLLALEATGLDNDSVIMVEKVSAIPRSKVGVRIGAVEPEHRPPECYPGFGDRARVRAVDLRRFPSIATQR